MSRRQDTRAMRPNAYDPWRHNRAVQQQKAIRRFARSARLASISLRRFGRTVAAVGAAFSKTFGTERPE